MALHQAQAELDGGGASVGRSLSLLLLFPKNVRLSYLYGKRVVLMLKEVESLSSHCEFTVVTETTSRPKVDEMPVQPTIVGQELMLEGYGLISWNKESILWLCIARVE
ncbi:unnamed protein product [Brassica oleracea var. botrytis]|uniref:Uncharacterized protein n=3 Tax=Brassica TaxID=3705 RepID=A0A0D3CP02_BRAOL|nr:hypothetical protein DY000_02058785 [Brassica cretica]VDD59899.1 unnamed protein product [Brassica oleracea]